MAFYRVIMVLLAPLLLLRAWVKGERRADLGQRLGWVDGPVGLWLHGASLGELTSARWLIEALQAARPGLRVLVTANTLTGRDLVQGWVLPGVQASLAPLDLGHVLRRFLRQTRPAALISLEAEYWPLRFHLCAAAHIPIVLMGARMSVRSFDRWQKRSALAAAMLGQVSLASAQDERSRQHLLALGLAPAHLLPDLDLKAEAAGRLPLAPPPPRASRANWLLAASTHAGEEAVILRAFAAQSRFSHLILAPRHPARAAEILPLLQGTAYAQRSAGAEPGAAPVFLADTLGEMDLWYARCGAVVIGGTFVPKGGHTPWEPMRHDCAILHGPDTANFAAPFAALDQAGGALAVTADSLAHSLQGLDAQAQDRMAAQARLILQAVGDNSAHLTRILAACGV
jgi:3-deoxy-D-manno-octulosonic-acid transferase